MMQTLIEVKRKDSNNKHVRGLNPGERITLPDDVAQALASGGLVDIVELLPAGMGIDSDPDLQRNHERRAELSHELQRKQAELAEAQERLTKLKENRIDAYAFGGGDRWEAEHATACDRVEALQGDIELVQAALGRLRHHADQAAEKARQPLIVETWAKQVPRLERLVDLLTEAQAVNAELQQIHADVNPVLTRRNTWTGGQGDVLPCVNPQIELCRRVAVGMLEKHPARAEAKQ